jgi:hypothetical protein
MSLPVSTVANIRGTRRSWSRGDENILTNVCSLPNKWFKSSRYWAPNAKQVAHMQREQSRQQKKKKMLVFSELPSLPSAGSRPGCLHISLRCEPRSLIRVSLGCSIIQKKSARKDNPTPAYSPVSDRRRLTAFVEVHWFP